MEFLKSVVNGKLIKPVRRHSGILAIELTASIGIAYLWNKGYKYLTPAVSLCCIGGTYLYCCIKSRDKILPSEAVIVTGCDSGLGYSLALHCRQIGATVIAGVLYDNGPGAENLRKQDILVYPLDITKHESVTTFVNSVRSLIKDKHLALRCLINNAAVMIFGEFEWQTEDQIRSQVEVNFLGTMRITRELIPMIREHSSRIIVISSHCNIQPIPGVAAYSGTKAAINAWATAIRVELKKHGVKVVCFLPGSFVGESKILSKQAEHFETMKNSMSKEAKDFYGDYFTKYSQYFSSVTGDTKLEKLQDTRIYDIFEGALLDKYPTAVYKYESWRYFVYHVLFVITPACLRDLLVQKFVQGPSWTERMASNASAVETSAPLELSTPRMSASNVPTEDLRNGKKMINDNSTGKLDSDSVVANDLS